MRRVTVPFQEVHGPRKDYALRGFDYIAASQPSLSEAHPGGSAIIHIKAFEHILAARIGLLG